MHALLMLLREEVLDSHNGAGGEKSLSYGNKSVNVPIATLHCIFLATHFSDDGEVITHISQLCSSLVNCDSNTN